MKRSISRLLLATCVSTVLLAAVTAFADHPQLARVLGVGPRGCGHVIKLLLKYGQGGRLHAVPYGNSLLLAPDLGDLELVSVVQLEECTDELGPTLGITIRNTSQRDVCEFSVAAVAVLRRITPLSPTTTIRIERLAVGEVVEVKIPLPCESLAMAYIGSQPLAFDTLVIAIDCFDELVECDESNNLLVVHRSKIPTQVVQPAPEADVPPNEEGIPEEPVTPPLPESPNVPSDIGGLDIDKIEWSDSDDS